MKFVARMFATLAVASLLVFSIRADDTPKPGTTTKPATTTDKDGAVKSSVASAAAGEAAPAAPAPKPAPPSGGVGSDTPKFELFLGYSNLLATPMSLSNRIVDLQGGDANVAFNFSRYVGLVGDFAGYHANTLTFNQAGRPISRRGR